MYDLFNNVSDLVGMIGVGLLLVAYFLLSTERISSMSLQYQLLNFFAAWLILFSLFFHWNTPSVAIEFFWILISIVGIVRIYFKRAK